VHQRGRFRWVPKQGYFKRLLQAHRLHHAVEGKHGTVSHGFLFARKPAVLKAQLRANADPQRRTPRGVDERDRASEAVPGSEPLPASPVSRR